MTGTPGWMQDLWRDHAGMHLSRTFGPGSPVCPVCIPQAEDILVTTDGNFEHHLLQRHFATLRRYHVQGLVCQAACFDEEFCWIEVIIVFILTALTRFTGGLLVRGNWMHVLFGRVTGEVVAGKYPTSYNEWDLNRIHSCCKRCNY